MRARGETKTISGSQPNTGRVLVMVGTDHVHGRRIMEGIADYVEHHHQRWRLEVEVAISAKPLARKGIAGMILEPDYDLVKAYTKVRCPAVTVGHWPLERGPVGVVVDNLAVGRLAANYLADLGLKHLAFVHSPPGIFSINRAAGCAEACSERNVSFHETRRDRMLSDTELRDWIKTLPLPVGILASHDRRGLAVSKACAELGLKIPEQIALIGVDNEAEVCRLINPPLSSVDHGTRRIGYEAARVLDEWMTTGRRPPNPKPIQPLGVVSRPSTDLLAVSDPEVVAALRFIRSNADRPLKVKDVMNHVAMSRRALEMHFRESISRTVHQEIMRVRIDRAKSLLIGSDMSIVAIGDACGFGFPSQFSNAFHRETGLTPVGFRKQYRYRSEP